MDKAAIDIAKALVRLSELTIFELRGEWAAASSHAAADAALPRSLDELAEGIGGYHARLSGFRKHGKVRSMPSQIKVPYAITC